MAKEALARIKIDEKLKEAGWRFFPTEAGNANISLELKTKLETFTKEDLDNIDESYTNSRNGFADYILKDEYGKPLVVLEAKRKKTHPLSAKEQAREYAESMGVRYVILSNGDLDYFWDLEHGDPDIITKYPTYESLKSLKQVNIDTEAIKKLDIDEFYVATSQEPSIVTNPIWKLNDKSQLFGYCVANDIRVLRDYQLEALERVRQEVIDGFDRHLLVMATGTGKTLTSAAIIKMFIRSGLVHRVLFLVDRIELENQAEKNLTKYLRKDGIITKIYKEGKERDEWESSDVLVSTVQSFTLNDKYKDIFNPTDFDLVISDEAHRSLGNSSRAVFEYFVGYKLGLTATPKDLMKGVKYEETDSAELERRLYNDTYQIFGHKPGNPTYSFQLQDGIKKGVLVGPTVVDARTEITTELLSEKGLIIVAGEDDNMDVVVRSEDGRATQIFTEKGYEKEFFSEATNIALCQTFMENAMRDPITNEIGKSIIFCVSINHALKITQILNKMATQMFPGMYNSDFAMQITSDVHNAQQMTLNFADNNLRGQTKWLEDYNSSKSRVAVTVGMMTTGYDCQDILNIGLFRPIFSATDFIQIKGRGTRTYTFKDPDAERQEKKTTFKLFDFFATCEYFEEKFNYDEKVKMPKPYKKMGGRETLIDDDGTIEKVIYRGDDLVIDIKQQDLPIGKIDIMLNKTFEDKIERDEKAQKYINNKDLEGFIWYLKNEIFEKPNEFFNVKKIEKSIGLDRKLTVREVAMKLMGLIDHYKNKSEMLEDEFDNFKLINKDDCEKYAEQISEIESVFQAYVLNENVRKAIDTKDFGSLMTTPLGNDIRNLVNVSFKGRTIFEYIKDYVSESDLNCESFKR
ncbi:MAG: DEAD/DEAH box helicase family protein [Bacilli bacterium]|nr:DEAD/DEAH box helicase family protein [Bacilli bacterium]